MKRTLAILAVPVLAIGYLVLLAIGSAFLGRAFGPHFGWVPVWLACVIAAIGVGAAACEAIHRLIHFISTAPRRNRRF